MVHMFCLLVLVASVGASTREIEFKSCKPLTDNLTCKVKAVEISGCLSPSSWVDKDGGIIEYQEGNVKNPCRIDSGSALNLSIAFEPGFSMSSPRTQIAIPDLTNCRALVSQVNSTDVPCPLWGPQRTGCLHTHCPLLAGRRQWYEDILNIPNDFSRRPVNFRKIYQLRWKLWNKRNKKHSCCFSIPVQY
uniref:MD-2-related lipid-recognition domain-containing protein n=1 Tax=Graphocephala atropunctata TaxID=36148 RepID=A0A1B6MCF9_9HEMI